MRKVSDGQPWNNFRWSAIFSEVSATQWLGEKHKYIDVHGQPQVRSVGTHMREELSNRLFKQRGCSKCNVRIKNIELYNCAMIP